MTTETNLPEVRLDRIARSRVDDAAAGVTGRVFPGRSQSGHLKTVAPLWRAAREAAGIPAPVAPYSARHTFATNALAATGNPAAVMKAMGRASAQTAMIYQHPGLETIRKSETEGNLNGSTSQTRRNVAWFASARSAGC